MGVFVLLNWLGDCIGEHRLHSNTRGHGKEGRREMQIRQRRVVMRTKNVDHKVDVQVYWVCNRRGGEMSDYGGVVHSNIREGYIRDT